MKLYNLQEYELTEDNKENYNLLKVVLTIFIIVIIIIICKFKISIYRENVLLNDNNNYLIIADIDMLDTLSTTKKIVINNNKYSFKIINTDNYSNINGTIYQTVYLDINDYKSNIKVNKCYFLKSKNTLLDSLIKFMQGG